MQRFGLRDDQWERIKDLLPGREGHVGGNAADNRLFVDAVLYRYRTGVPWRDLPARFGDWNIGPIARRTDDQDSCARRRFGQSCRTDAYARTADRCGPNHVTEVASEFIFRQCGPHTCGLMAGEAGGPFMKID